MQLRASQARRAKKFEESARFEERYRELESTSVQKVDTTAASCKQTSEHVEGHNVATAAADKKKDEAA